MKLAVVIPFALFGLSAALPPLAFGADVQSLTLSPTDVATGAASTGTVRLDGGSAVGTRVTLQSSRPELATVPASVTVGALPASFAVTTVAGQAGCARISATAAKSGVTRRADVFVLPVVSPEASLKLALSKPSVVGAQSLTATVRMPQPTLFVPGQVVQLASSDPLVVVPATAPLVQSREGGLQATFTITTSVTGATTCSVIKATHGGSSAAALLKVFAISG
jgi:hypothetical protein